MAKDENLPLSGLKVVDISTLAAGGFISTFMGDFGADVIKVEHPRYGDRLREFCEKPLKTGWASWWTVYSRNKKCVTLDLSKEKGQELFKKLIANADILIENFRPGTLERWNIGWEVLSELNRKLVMVRVTTFGQTGPYRDRPGFGTLAEAMSGFAHITGFPDGPPTLPPLALADGIAALCGTWAAMFAIYDRDIHGRAQGQFIDLSIYEPIFAILGPQTTDFDQLGMIQQRVGNRVPFAAPRNAYRTKDGRWAGLSATTQPVAERVLKAVGREELIRHPKFKDNRARVQNVDELDGMISEWIGSHTLEEVIQRFEECEAAIAPIYDISQIVKDPHFLARETIKKVPDNLLGEVTMQNVIPKMSETPGKIRWTGPRMGAHNREIFLERLGLTEAQLEELYSEQVI